MIKEFGSDFPFMSNLYDYNTKDNIIDLLPNSINYISGRCALYNLLKLGIKKNNWKRIHIPEYYCHEVTGYLVGIPIDICYYDFGPYSSDFNFTNIDKVGSAVLLVNYFGEQINSDYKFLNAYVIEDHTHSLISSEAIDKSQAHYCFASLRKILPVPAGGIVWSPQKLELPSSSKHEINSRAIYMKLCGMLIKEKYLNGYVIAKSEYRTLLINSEHLLSQVYSKESLPLLILNMIRSISISKLKEIKSTNLILLTNLIKNKQNVFSTNKAGNAEMLGLILILKTKNLKEKVKKHLINNFIYPAVLWPEQRINKAQIFSDTMLFIHCDARYNEADMHHIAHVINEIMP